MLSDMSGSPKDPARSTTLLPPSIPLMSERGVMTIGALLDRVLAAPEPLPAPGRW